MTSPLQEAFVGLDATIARLLASENLGLREIPEALRQIRGRIGDREVLLSTDACQSEAIERVVYARMAFAGDGDAISRTLVVVPRGDGIIFGLDIVAMAGKVSLLAMDATGTVDTWSACAGETLRASRRALQGFQDRPLPAFAEGAFSPDAIVGSLAPGREHTMLVAVEPLVSLALNAAQVTFSDRSTASASALRWLAAERQNRKERNALARIFGADVAERYLDRYVFADPEANAGQR